MIKLWIQRRISTFNTLYSPLYIYNSEISHDGSVRLSDITWFHRLVREPGDVKIGMDFLNQGYKI